MGNVTEVTLAAIAHKNLHLFGPMKGHQEGYKFQTDDELR
jgi:hypothetical protein